MVKGLPMAYNRDLQEDREALFDAVETTTECLSVMAGMWEGLSIHSGRYEEALKGDFFLATELADYLAAKGVPFREAHHVVGRLVKECEEAEENFTALTVERLKKAHSAFEADALEWLVPESAAERRVSFGGTASTEIARQVASLRARISKPSNP